MEKVYLKDSDVVNELITTIPVATTEKNGLKPASDVRKERAMATQVSRVVYEWNTTTAMNTSLLISISVHGGGPMTLFYMAIYRSADILKPPTIILNRIGGANVPATPRFKIWSNESTGAFKIIFERTQFTPYIYVKILNTIISSTDSIPFSTANQGEVDAAVYIEETNPIFIASIQRDGLIQKTDTHVYGGTIDSTNDLNDLRSNTYSWSSSSVPVNSPVTGKSGAIETRQLDGSGHVFKQVAYMADGSVYMRVMYSTAHTWNSWFKLNA